VKDIGLEEDTPFKLNMLVEVQRGRKALFLLQND